jgi:hypothetical protein
MFLGLLFILAGGLWLASLISAIPAPDATVTFNPLVAMYVPTYEGLTSGYVSVVAPIIQTGESIAYLLIGVGLLLGLVGCLRKER